VLAGLLIIPAWRHHPGVFVGKIAFLRLRESCLIPGMAGIDRATAGDDAQAVRAAVAKLPLEQAVKEAIEAGRKYMRAGSADLA